MDHRGKEYETIFHLIYLGVLSVFGILLLVTGTIIGNSIITRCILLAMMLIVWGIHFLQIGSANQRIYFYTITATLFMMYYGSKPASLTDMPLVLCIMMIILSAQADIGLIYLISISYPLMILHHIFITGYISLDMNKASLSRIIFGAIGVIVAIVISRFFSRSNENSKRDKLEMMDEIEIQRKKTQDLLSNVSHELRTPIGAITGVSEILLNEDLDDDVEAKVLDINHAGNRIYHQVNSILDFAELATNKMVLNEHTYLLRSLVERCVDELNENPNPRGVKCIANIQDHMPQYLEGDDQKIYRVVCLLLENAHKFTNSGSVTLSIGFRKESYGGNLNIEVRDTGLGMSDKLVKRLFHGVYKEDSESTRMTSGLGIGFTIAREMTRIMHGFITVESVEGSGSCIRVSVPQKVPAKMPEPVKTNVLQSDSYQNLRVLIIDDEQLNLKVVRGMLRTFGIQAKIAESGSEGLALCELEDYDLILLDYMMPEMDGEETLHRIRAARNGYYKNTPIVALTANAASDARKMFLEMGFDEFVSKPVEIKTLKEMLEQMVGGQSYE